MKPTTVITHGEESAVTLRLFAGIANAAGVRRVEFNTNELQTVADLLHLAKQQFGPSFAEQLKICQIWIDGETATENTQLLGAKEVALLPPVSGG